jgi:hypothetical protein
MLERGRNAVVVIVGCFRPNTKTRKMWFHKINRNGKKNNATLKSGGTQAVLCMGPMLSLSTALQRLIQSRIACTLDKQHLKSRWCGSAQRSAAVDESGAARVNNVWREEKS